MTQYQDALGQPIVLGRELGRGGQGTVYAVSDRPGAVAKVYLQRPDLQTTRKLDALTRASDAALLEISAWPQVLLKDGSGHVQGFVMPLVSEREYHELHQLYRISSRKQAFPTADWRFLVHVARNVTRAFGTLHSRGHLMGDVSSRNIMVSQNGTVRFIDTDSFQVKVGTDTYPCPVGTAEFTPPELQGKRFGTLVRTVEHDLFGLAQLIFHLLFDGRHPYAGVHHNGAMPSPAEAIAADQFAYSLTYHHGVQPPPLTLTLKGLHSSLAALFERAFSPQHQGRPNTAEWDSALAELSKQITTCQKKAEHKHDRRTLCPWCALWPGNAQVVTTKTKMPSKIKRLDVDAELNRIWVDLASVDIPAPHPVLQLKFQPTPLALPPYPQLNMPKRKVFSASALLWGVALTLAGLWGLNQGWIWPAVLSLLLAWWSFSLNSNNQQRQRLQKLDDEACELYTQLYRTSLQAKLKNHQAEVGKLRQTYQQLVSYETVTRARVRYSARRQALETLRAGIVTISREEQAETKKAIEGCRQPLLDTYLQQYLIRPGVIPGIGAALVQELHQNNVFSAKDVNQKIHSIKGLGPKRKQDLLDWRATLEQFFQFDPVVAESKLDIIYLRLDQKRNLQLRQLDQNVQQLKSDLTVWHAEHGKAVKELHETGYQLHQRERTIELVVETIESLDSETWKQIWKQISSN